jgi:hypothetical protein
MTAATLQVPALTHAALRLAQSLLVLLHEVFSPTLVARRQQLSAKVACPAMQLAADVLQLRCAAPEGQQQRQPKQQQAPPTAPASCQQAVTQAQAAARHFKLQLTAWLCADVAYATQICGSGVRVLRAIADTIRCMHQQQAGQSVLRVPDNPAQRGRASCSRSRQVLVSPIHQVVLRAMPKAGRRSTLAATLQGGQPAVMQVLASSLKCIIHDAQQRCSTISTRSNSTPSTTTADAAHAPAGDLKAPAAGSGADSAHAAPKQGTDAGSLLQLGLHLAVEALLVFPLESVKAAARLLDACHDAFSLLQTPARPPPAPGNQTQAAQEAAPAAYYVQGLRCSTMARQLLSELLPHVAPALLYAARQQPQEVQADVAALQHSLARLLRALLLSVTGESPQLFATCVGVATASVTHVCVALAHARVQET